MGGTGRHLGVSATMLSGTNGGAGSYKVFEYLRVQSVSGRLTVWKSPAVQARRVEMTSRSLAGRCQWGRHQPFETVSIQERLSSGAKTVGSASFGWSWRRSGWPGGAADTFSLSGVAVSSASGAVTAGDAPLIGSERWLASRVSQLMNEAEDHAGDRSSRATSPHLHPSQCATKCPNMSDMCQPQCI